MQEPETARSLDASNQLRRAKSNGEYQAHVESVYDSDEDASTQKGPAATENGTFPIPIPNHGHGAGASAPSSLRRTSTASNWTAPPPYSASDPARDAQRRNPSFSRSPRSASPKRVRFLDDLDGGLGIPWRIRLRTLYWDYEDDKLVGTNMENPGEDVWKNPEARTDVSSAWVCEEAIAPKYRYTPYKKQSTDTRGSLLPEPETTYYSIKCPLKLKEVEELVKRSALIYRQRAERSASIRPRQVQRLQSDKPSLNKSPSCLIPPSKPRDQLPSKADFDSDINSDGRAIPRPVLPLNPYSWHAPDAPYEPPLQTPTNVLRSSGKKRRSTSTTAREMQRSKGSSAARIGRVAGLAALVDVLAEFDLSDFAF